MTPRPAPSAHSGSTEWLVQRATAIYLAGFLLYVLFSLMTSPPMDHSAWRAWFGHGPVRIGWALAFGALLVHTWIGLRSVIIDYLRPAPARLLAYLLTAVGLLAMMLWCAHILMGIGGQV